MKWQDRIEINPQILAGKPVVKGSRIAVGFVIDLMGRGWSVEQILVEYNHLTTDDIRACLIYAAERINQ